MKQMKIASIKDIEILLKVVYRFVPRAPRRLHGLLVAVAPYLALIAGTLSVSVALLPYFFDHYPLDPLASAALYSLNAHLVRMLFALMGIILMISFNRLLKRRLVAWYNLFIVTLFYAFIVLIVFSVPSLITLLLVWAYLFEIQASFSDTL